MTDLSNIGNDPMRSDDAAYRYGDSAEAGQAAASQDTEWDAADYAVEKSADDEPTAGGASEKSAVFLMCVLLVLAVAASVVMLFAGSAGWMKIAVLLALWSAVIGVVLVSRYRKAIALERERLQTIEQLHRVELDRELATHREQELILEQNYLDSLEGNNDDNIAALRAEVFALRAQLAEFMGEDFDDEQVALRARAERLRELGSPQPEPPLKDPSGNNRPTPRATMHREEVTANGTVGAHTQYGGEAGASSQVEDAEATDMRRAFAPSGQPVDVPEVADSTDSKGRTYRDDYRETEHQPTQEKFSTGSFRAIHWEETTAQRPGQDRWATPDSGKSNRDGRHREGAASQHGVHVASDARRSVTPTESDSPTLLLPTIDNRDESSSTQSTTGNAAEGASEPLTNSNRAAAAHGRRRAEDHQGSLTVAELMAQMRQKNGN